MKKHQIEIRIGETLKELRKKQRLTLVELSQRSSVQVATISRMENNKMTGTLETLAVLAMALDVELWELLKNCKTTQIKHPFSGLG